MVAHRLGRRIKPSLVHCGELGAGALPPEQPLIGSPHPHAGPEAIDYLARKGIRCVATDAPDLGGVEPKRAAHVYWALGSRGMAGIEFLVNVAAIPPRGAYFLFAAVKIRDCHAGPGRAIVLYDAGVGDEGAGTVPGGR